MMKNKKLLVLICTTILLIPILGKTVHAATYHDYEGTVPAINDKELLYNLN